MSRFTKYLAAAMLALPVIGACGDDPVPPPPTGTISGKVMVESQGIDGATVTLNTGVSATTASGGAFSFQEVDAGAYTVTLSNFPEDASFSETSASATISEDGQVVAVKFTGSWIRTSVVLGSVEVEGDGLSGITVKVTGPNQDAETETTATGEYAFTGFRAGDYTVEISGFNSDDVGFGSTSATITIDVGESRVVSFEGTYVRASAVLVRVTIEGNGLENVLVTLQGKGESLEARTNSSGQHLFEDLRRGDYAIGIANPDPDEYGFDVTSQNVTVSMGETADVPFAGIPLRTAEINGQITVEGKPLDGVTVSLSGRGDDPDPVVTPADGRFSFERLHAGDYTISIFGFDTDEYDFDATSENVTVKLKETATVGFDGIMLRTAAIMGTVTVKGKALPGVTVTVSGGLTDEEYEAKTNSTGTYEFERLHAGDYSVTISGYDTGEYGFDVTTKSVSVDLRETADVAFDGILLRTAGVSGRVTVGGEAMGDQMIMLSGEEDRTGKTNANGQYGFSGLAAGSYTLAVTGYDGEEYEFHAVSFSLELDEAAIQNVEGRSLRTVAFMGTVSAEGDPLAGVVVTLIKLTGSASGEIVGVAPTTAMGGYMFGDLLAATYRVNISDFDDEFDFPRTFWVGAVKTDDTTTVDFDAEIIRTASVSGTVTVDGDGMADLEVTLAGDYGTAKETKTVSDGSYMFEGLRKGDYTVKIMNPDETLYEFAITERLVSLAVAQAQRDVSFAGITLRRASISGQVNVEEMGLAGVTVMLSGEESREATTDGNGEYNFPALGAGDYTVKIVNPNSDAYIFEVTEEDVKDLGSEEAEIVDFKGEHTTTASLSGVLFADEVTVDGMYTDGEPLLPFEDFPMLLQGPGLDDVTPGNPDATGAYSFDALKAGTYNLVIDLKAEHDTALAEIGYAFEGEKLNIGIEVPAATDVDLDFPFRITKQTIHIDVVLAAGGYFGDPVGGVVMELYPTLEDVVKGTNLLNTATSDSKYGITEFNFARVDDRGPGDTDSDFLVFAKVKSSPADLFVHTNDHIAIKYEAVDRWTISSAPVKLINTRVNFQWWVKSLKTDEGGDKPLGGWKATNGEVTDTFGLATYTDTVTEAQRNAMIEGTPASFSVSLGTQDTLVTMNESWSASPALTNTHSGLTLSAKNNDLGAIYVRWITQSLVMGFYRELDDHEGYSQHVTPHSGADARPSMKVLDDFSIELRAPASNRRYERLEWDHDDDPDTDNVTSLNGEFAIGADGLVRFPRLPADKEIVARFRDDSADRVIVTYFDRDIDLFNRDLDFGPTMGAFGKFSGTTPEVRVCLATDPLLDLDDALSDEHCATYGYQWTTNTATVDFMSRSHADDKHSPVDTLASEMEVEFESATPNHGADAADSTAKINQEHHFGNELQDGIYWLSTSSTDDYLLDGYMLNNGSMITNSTAKVSIYHDEDTDRGKAVLVDFLVTVRDPKDNALLSSLSLDGASLNPTFDPAMTAYTADVAHDVSSIEVMWERADTNSTTDPAESPHTATLNDAGMETDIKVMVTSMDSTVTREYTVTVMRAEAPAKSDNAYLDTLSLDGVDLDMPFDKETMEYTAEVGPAVDSLTLMWRTADSNATTDPAGSSHRFDLDEPGDRTDLTVTVTAEDGETKMEYTVTVTRAEENDNAALMSLGVKLVGDDGEPVPLTPEFSSDVTEYTARTLNSTVEKVEVMWMTSDRYATTDMASPYELELDDPGETESLDIVVMASDGETKQTYTLTVHRAVESADADLGSLELVGAELVPMFESHIIDYTAEVTSDIESIKGMWETAHDGATTTPEGSDSTWMLGAAGTTTDVIITVTSEDEEKTETYTITVTRALPSDVATLATLALDGMDLDGFMSEDTMPMAEVGPAVETVMVTWTTTHEKATTDPASSQELVLGDAGTDTELMIVVTAEDGEAKQTYTLMVTRAAESEDADLGSLMLKWPDDSMKVNLRPRVKEYEVKVEDHNVTEVEVVWMTSDKYATTDPVSPHDLKLDDDYGEAESMDIVVMASDGETKKTYTLKVRRGEPSKNADIASSQVAGEPQTVYYDDIYATVDHDLNEVTVTWILADENATSVADPMDADSSTEGHQLELVSSQTTMSIEVTAEDGETRKTYKVWVTRRPTPSSDATLKELVMDSGDLNEAFVPEDTIYTADVPHEIDEVTFTIEPASGATAVADPVDADDATADHQLELGSEGSATKLMLTVTAEDGMTKMEYTVTVTRAEESDDATLKSLSGVDLNESFDKDLMVYTADVGSTVKEVEVMWMTSDKYATTDPESPHMLEMDDPGPDTDLTITVISEDETDTLTYTLTVTRTAPGFVFNPETLAVDEGADSNSYTVALEMKPSAEVAVIATIPTTTGLTFSAGGTTATLTFDTLNWDTAQAVYFNVAADADDDDAEENSPIMIMHSANGHSDGSVAVTIDETDTRGVILSATEKEVAEGESIEYTMVLNSQPTGSGVAVSVTGAPSGVTVLPSLVQFTENDWNTPKSVTISTVGLDDDTISAHDTLKLSHRAVGGGYDTVSVDDVDVRILDDESASVVISTTRVMVADTGMFKYTISLTQEPDVDEEVTVRLIYSSADFTVTGSPAVFTNGNWNGVEVTVTPEDVTSDMVKILTHTVVSEGGEEDENGENGPKYRSATASLITITVKDVP